MNKRMEAARASIVEKAQATDFAAMTPAEFSEWVDGLPQLEFIALMDMRSAFAHGGKPVETTPDIGPAFMADDPRDSWVDYDGSGQAPVTGDVIVWITVEDGDICGPNRADAFMWDGPVAISSYAIAKNAKPRQTES